MRFHSKYVHARYAMIPDDNEPVGLHRTRKVKGVAAVFDGNVWDSEIAQQENGWSDETREEMERHLQEHYDFGRTLHSVSSEQVDAAVASARPAPANCLFVRVIDGESWLCSRPAVSEDGYCEEHATEIEDSPQAKPNRRKEPVS